MRRIVTLGATLLVAGACSFEWDDLDPRVGEGGGGVTSSTGQGAGTTSAGGEAGMGGTPSGVGGTATGAGGTPGGMASSGSGGGGGMALPNGQPCSAGSDCQSGFCPGDDGVCCASACSGDCEACAQAKTGTADGTCADVTSGTDPNGDCAAASVCLTGACTDRARVFVTSSVFPPMFGGATGADAECAAHASAAGLPGSYLAWISDGNTTPLARFTQVPVPYRLVDGTKIADDWGDLVDGTIDGNIDKDEMGNPGPTSNVMCGGNDKVWTGTNEDGTPVNHCNGWTGSGSGTVGKQDLASIWSNACSMVSCSGTTAALYCFQQ